MTAHTTAAMVETALEQARHYASSAPPGSGGAAPTPRGGSLPGTAAANCTPGYHARRRGAAVAGPVFRFTATGAFRWPAPATASGPPTAPGGLAEDGSSASPCSLAEASSVAQPVAPPVALAGAQQPLVQLFPLPSPCPATFAVNFHLTEPADVRLDLLDDRGRKVLGVMRRSLAGNSSHRISLVLDGLGLPPGNYTCQLRVLQG